MTFRNVLDIPGAEVLFYDGVDLLPLSDAPGGMLTVVDGVLQVRDAPLPSALSGLNPFTCVQQSPFFIRFPVRSGGPVTAPLRVTVTPINGLDVDREFAVGCGPELPTDSGGDPLFLDVMGVSGPATPVVDAAMGDLALTVGVDQYCGLGGYAVGS